MLPPDPGALLGGEEVIGLSTHTGATDGSASFAGTSGMAGTSAGYAYNHMHATSDQEMENSSFSTADSEGVAETEGWSVGSHDDHGIAHQSGASEAWTRGTNRSTTRGTTITNTEAVTDGDSDTVGKTLTRGKALTEGETITHGESVALTPFYEYVREEIETPIFLTPEEQKLLVMQKLANIPKQHFLVKAPDSPDCVVRAPHVPDPSITKRRLATGLESVYSALPCYTRLEQHNHDGIVHHDDGTVEVDVNDVIDVVAHEVRRPQRARVLPSPAVDDEPIFWQSSPPAGPGGRQQKL